MSEENIGTATAAAKTEKESPVYDVEAKNRFDLEVRHTDGHKYDTAHIYGPLSDERYLQWLNEFHIKGTEDDVSEEAREASVRLWDDIIDSLDNVEIAPGTDFRHFIDPSEKIESLNRYLAVAIGEEDAPQTPKRKLGEPVTDVSLANLCVLTEAWFNNEVSVQKHHLKPKTLELQKKYARIQGKRFKQEQTRGLRRKPKIEYVPQDARIGELYDEMVIKADGFAPSDFASIPLRFKTIVIHSVFDDTVAGKKQQP